MDSPRQLLPEAFRGSKHLLKRYDWRILVDANLGYDIGGAMKQASGDLFPYTNWGAF